MNKIHRIGIILGLIFLMLSVAHAQQHTTGTLKKIEKTQPVKQLANGKYEYTLTWDINGITIYTYIYMSDAEYIELKSLEGEFITIFFQSDGQGHSIFIDWQYGSAGTHYKRISDKLIEVDEINGTITPVYDFHNHKWILE